MRVLGENNKIIENDGIILCVKCESVFDKHSIAAYILW